MNKRLLAIFTLLLLVSSQAAWTRPKKPRYFTVRILTKNMLFSDESLVDTPSRLDAMAIEIASQDADIICLREAALLPLDFTRMLLEKLKENHGQKFKIVGHLLLGTHHHKTIATLVRKSLKSKKLGTYLTKFSTDQGSLTTDLTICGRPLRIINTHYDNNDQALQLLNQEVLPSPYPVIIAGSFVQADELIDTSPHDIRP